MSKDPAFLFYSDNFLSGVADLTMEERGQYITMMCLQHQKGHLSDKIIRLSIPNISPDVLSKFHKDENGLLYSPRLEKEIEKRKQHSEKQRLRALDGWQKRKNGGEAVADAVALPLGDGNGNEDSPKDKYKDRPKNLEMVIEYFKEKNIVSPEANAEKFFYHYETNGWMRGKNKIKSWRLCTKNWTFEEIKQTAPKGYGGLTKTEWELLNG